MPRMASIEQMSEFWSRCLKALNRQVEPLPSEEAKKMAIQAVQRVLRNYLGVDGSGAEAVLALVAYPVSPSFPSKQEVAIPQTDMNQIIDALNEFKNSATPSIEGDML